MRPIDADALMNDIDKEMFSTESRKCYEKMRIRKQPTIDAVKVVRCKDCGRSEPDCLGEGYVYCNHTGMVVLDNDYCSYGECKMNLEDK